MAFVSFCTPAQLILQYDSRRVRELASDSGSPVAEADIATNSVLLNALGRATEMILSACRVSEEYTEEELQALALDSDNLGVGYQLRGLCADLAFGLLVMRRGTGAADLDRLSPAFAAAQRTLQMIEDGSRIFARYGREIDAEPNADAGNPRTADLTQQTTTPTNSWAAAATSRLIPSSPLNGNTSYPPA